ncbi:DUF1232 domain-containing protein [Leptospira ognonensis]|uniref:DUF1232 domain-containing protein n=1 Tax=Leptospira ognonensis TaxID=2484945 RepID=A0A4R9K9S9_9LEPT|nr:YkvA family protein [Leptospira ognonensis]TGL62710.1 DUF1232 domain-containing protein [Leptospira ognonensis]
MEPAEKDSFVKENFWGKVKKFGEKIPFLKDVVAMYYCLLDEKTPLKAKASITLALVYFISPIDAIPDFIAALGFTDDIGIIATTLLLIKTQLKEEHYEQAEAALKNENPKAEN